MDYKNSTFYFERYEFDQEEQTIHFVYSYDHELFFTEKWKLETENQAQESELLQRVLFNLHLAVGMSYWKAFCPEKMEVLSGKLTEAQAAFWNTLYTKGLGEFFYENQIDFRNLVQFPYELEEAPETLPAETTDEALLMIGGGKDSLLSLNLLKGMKLPFDTFTLGSYDLIRTQVEIIGEDHQNIKRQLSPELFALNKEGAYNGHVPISAIYAFSALLVSVINGYSYIIASNENSANEGNVEYLYEMINHQWSKTFQFENLLRSYIRSFITGDIEYFSLLRPLSELHIAKLFANHKEWLPIFSSCNTHFSIHENVEKHWCGSCPKCAFAFALLAPFIEKAHLESIFQKNLFADPELLPLFQDLLGMGTMKPFDCVGTPEETQVALYMAHERREYEDDIIMKYFVDDVLPNIEDIEGLREEAFALNEEHAIPKPFNQYIDDIRGNS